jgi:hypothetical protein
LSDVFLPDNRFESPGLLYPNRKTYERTRIDRSLSIANEMRFHVSLSGNKNCYESVTEKFGIYSGTPGDEIIDGNVASTISGSNYYEIEHDDLFNITGDITIAWIGKLVGASNQHFCGKHIGNGATFAPYDFRTGSSNKATIVRSDASSFRIQTGPNLTKNIDLSVVYTGYDVPTTLGNWVVNGIQSASVLASGGSGSDILGNTHLMRIGRRTLTGIQLDGAVSFVVGWGRILGYDEIISFINNPTQMLIPQ